VCSAPIEQRIYARLVVAWHQAWLHAWAVQSVLPRSSANGMPRRQDCEPSGAAQRSRTISGTCFPTTIVPYKAWGQIYRVSPNSPFALLSKVGEDCAGAVQSVTDEWMTANANSPGDVQWTDESAPE
jgi:hypothetical protein